ncbi:ATP-binding mismatch repair protein [Malassezia brasiliensis]|uniref:ATP-binding mismatch repair protein n=1 Tax=Malassezia brasiliensis TaxID=1821822 RepID=A0AAF0DS20_9BASI|nr:ATP-binding mismatch repair protein [Malassezia brasiliensis]
MSIAPLARTDVQRITSAQVVPDLRAAVKELVENALDAGARSIEVRFREYGLAGIEVLDDGSGVAPADYATLALKHHTSKLSSFDDLQSVTTLGFRGEALASLCGVARVSVLTATQREVPMGTVLEFDTHGVLTSSNKRVARQRGTTVTVTELLQQFPVRRKELERNVKREYNKAHAMLQAYALITPGVRWASSVTLANGKRTTQLALRAADGERYLQANMAALFGTRAIESLLPLALEIEVEGVPLRVVGLVSKPDLGAGRSSGDRQYFYVNRRPWDARKLAQVFNQVYKNYNMAQYPCVVANLEVATDQYDVNVSPDKRTILVHHEAALLEAIRDALDAFFAPTRGVLQVHGPGAEAPSNEPSAAAPRDIAVDERTASPTDNEAPYAPVEATPVAPEPPSNDPASPPPASLSSDQADAPMSPPPPTPPRAHQTPSKRPGSPVASVAKTPRTTLSVSTRQASWSPHREPRHEASSPPKAPASEIRAQFRRAVEKFARVQADAPLVGHEELEEASEGLEEEPESEERSDELEEESDDVLEDTHEKSSDPESNSEAASPMPQRTGPRTQAPVHDVVYAESEGEEDELVSQRAPTQTPDTHSDSSPAPAVSLQPTETPTAEAAPASDASVSVPPPLTPTYTLGVDVGALAARIASSHAPAHTTPIVSDALDSAGVQEQDIERASHALERVIRKTDFAQMHIVGQFNLGFIIARRHVGGSRGTPVMDDLFIIDQHAADEKYNFECLQRDTRIHSQRLIRPQVLELAPSDELVAAEHADWLKQNGFEIDVDEAQAPGRRVRLWSKPMSKGTVFDVHDLEELLYGLREAPSHTRIRCSKIRDLLASRACRKSIMVGSALNARQMRDVVQHMGEIEQPWNCPHGRPTMRHLTSLGHAAHRAWRAPAVDWSRLS